MNKHVIERQFTRIGARARVHPATPLDRGEGLTIDISRDNAGEFFDIAVAGGRNVETRVLDVQPSLRHLLLMSDQTDGKHKFLCGHDERHWFVAAVPERAAVSTVKTAFDALKPVAVRALEEQLRQAVRERRAEPSPVRTRTACPGGTVPSKGAPAAARPATSGICCGPSTTALIARP